MKTMLCTGAIWVLGVAIGCAEEPPQLRHEVVPVREAGNPTGLFPLTLGGPARPPLTVITGDSKLKVPASSLVKPAGPPAAYTIVLTAPGEQPGMVKKTIPMVPPGTYLSVPFSLTVIVPKEVDQRMAAAPKSEADYAVVEIEPELELIPK